MKKIKKKNNHHYISLIAILFFTYAVTFPGGLITKASIDVWYENLIKPAFNPPNWVFGPVWTILYTMMAVAAWLAYKRSND